MMTAEHALSIVKPSSFNNYGRFILPALTTKCLDDKILQHRIKFTQLAT